MQYVNIEILNNTNSRISSPYVNVLPVVRDGLTYVDESARFTRAYKTRVWDGKIHYLNAVNVFPTGLLPQVCELLRELNIQIRITDGRRIPYIPNISEIPKKFGKLELRDYQYTSVTDCFTNSIGDSPAIPFCRGIIYTATNSGKSLMAAAIAKSLMKHVSVLYLCHKREILNQVVEWLMNYLKTDIGIYDRTTEDIESVTVGMISTFYARLKSQPIGTKKLLEQFGCIIIDEAHHASSDSWAKVIGLCTNAFYRFALSGTALRSEEWRNAKLRGMTGGVLSRVTNEEMVGWGFSAKPSVTMLSYKNRNLDEDKDVDELNGKIKKALIFMAKAEKEGDQEEVNKCENILRSLRRKRYALVYRLGIVRSRKRINEIASICKANSEKSILIVVNDINHGSNIVHVLLENNVECVFISGESGDVVRDSVKKKFEKGKLRVLIASMIYKEGVDVPCIDILIVACGGKAPHTILQVFGRGLRKSRDKNNVEVYDFMDTSHAILERHSNMRKEIYAEEGFEPKII
jgi:superfamily II DNA or RNA helicase